MLPRSFATLVNPKTLFPAPLHRYLPLERYFHPLTALSTLKTIFPTPLTALATLGVLFSTVVKAFPPLACYIHYDDNSTSVPALPILISLFPHFWQHFPPSKRYFTPFLTHPHSRYSPLVLHTSSLQNSQPPNSQSGSLANGLVYSATHTFFLSDIIFFWVGMQMKGKLKNENEKKISENNIKR